MREYILELFESTGQLTLDVIVQRLGAASILACFIFLAELSRQVQQTVEEDFKRR